MLIRCVIVFVILQKTKNTETPPQVQRSKSQPFSQRDKSITKKPSIDQHSISTKQSKEKKKFFSLKIFSKNKKKGQKKNNSSGGSFPSGDQPKQQKSKISKNKDALLTRVDSGERSI